MRALVALLLVLNLAFFAFSRGWLEPLIGLSARHEREPQRLTAQIDAASVRVIDSRSAAPPCLRAGPFSAEQIEAAEAWLAQAQLPARAVRRTDAHAAWDVVLGPFADAAALSRRQDALRREGIQADEIGATAGTSASLSLGRFDDQAAAEAALAQWQQRGQRDATLVPAAPSYWLRVEPAERQWHERLQGLPPAFPGRGFAPCR